jgi:UDPglucose 6-dehydrogenase
MQIAVVGTGYVGLVTGTCFAESGNNVTCIDIVEEKINKLKKGELPIYEPELDNLLHRNLQEDRINFTINLAEGVKEAKVIFMALPTPPGDDGSADLSYILGAAKDIAPLLKDYAIIVNKSTVPVGTAEKVRAIIEKEGATNFDVVSNPEFLREG